MNSQFTYCLILGSTLACPMALSFDRKVQFYKKWKYLFPAMLIPAGIYIAWDSWFTSKGVWSFNENYVTGIRLFNLPLEEILFFFIVPYCCVFIYECLRCYFPRINNSRTGQTILISLAIILLCIGVFYYNRVYTSWTFILNAIFIAAIFLWKSFFLRFNCVVFLLSWLVILIPFLVVNGFLTAIPVVLYNDAENLGIRISTIPIEDIFYGMLLAMMNIVIYEKLRNRPSLTSIQTSLPNKL